MTIWFIDDEEMLLEIFEDEFDEEIKSRLGCDVKYITHFDKCNPKTGDLVVHDLIGVGEHKRMDGVNYLCVSGSVADEERIDIFKPYHPNELLTAVFNKVET